MKFIASTFLASALYVALVNAHTTAYSVSVGGVSLGNGENVYIRSPPNNNPVKDIKSAAMACNVKGSTAVPKTVTLAAGETISTFWKHDNPNDDIVDGSHIGPIITYIAPIGDVNKIGWVKIAEDGFDGSKWAVDKLKAASGKWDVKIPSTLAAGEYILRQEIIALHEADSTFDLVPARGAQFYPDCVQLTVTGSGTTTLPAGVQFPGAYDYSTPGIKFNVYGAYSSYTIPGPKVWDGVSGGSAPAPAPSTSAAPAPAPSTSAAPAPAPTTSAAPAPIPTTSVAPAPVPTTSVAPAPVPTTSVAPAPVPTTSAAPAPVPTTSTKAPAPVPTTSAAPAPAPAPTGGVKDANQCYREYNSCLDKTQPKPDWTGCTATREQCLIGARYFRLRRSAKTGRAL